MQFCLISYFPSPCCAVQGPDILYTHSHLKSHVLLLLIDTDFNSVIYVQRKDNKISWKYILLSIHIQFKQQHKSNQQSIMNENLCIVQITFITTLKCSILSITLNNNSYEGIIWLFHNISMHLTYFYVLTFLDHNIHVMGDICYWKTSTLDVYIVSSLTKRVFLFLHITVKQLKWERGWVSHMYLHRIVRFIIRSIEHRGQRLLEKCKQPTH